MSTYVWYDKSKSSFTKYCISEDFGIVDNKNLLDSCDDAASVNWGGKWRMPTKIEQDELRSNCTWLWTTQNETVGYLLIGINGNSIFLPASHLRDEGLVDKGVNGFYWSATVKNDGAYYIGFYDYCYDCFIDGGRHAGMAIRAVFK